MDNEGLPQTPDVAPTDTTQTNSNEGQFYSPQINPTTGEKVNQITHSDDAIELGNFIQENPDLPPEEKNRLLEAKEKELQIRRENWKPIEKKNDLVAQGLYEEYPNGLKRVELADGSYATILDFSFLMTDPEKVNENAQAVEYKYIEYYRNTEINLPRKFIFSKHGLLAVRNIDRNEPLAENDIDGLIEQLPNYDSLSHQNVFTVNNTNYQIMNYSPQGIDEKDLAMLEYYKAGMIMAEAVEKSKQLQNSPEEEAAAILEAFKH